MRDAVFNALSGRFFYGWTILGVAALGIFASGPGQSHTFSVFIAPISEDLGVTPAAVATAYAAATLVAAFGLPFMGRLTDKHGPRRMTLWVTLVHSVQQLQLTIRDDGQGFDQSQSAPTGHYGVAGMNERASVIGGTLQIESVLREGTTVQLVVLLKESKS